MIDAVKLVSSSAEAFTAQDVGNSSAEPISLERAKQHLRVVVPDEDDYIASLITAARGMAEGRLNRALVQRQLVAAFPTWCSRMALPKPPLVSVDSVTYLDTDGAQQSFAGYDVYENETPAVLAPSYGAALPALRWRPDAIRVTYTAGYADGEVPAQIIAWMLLVIGTLYENRETMSAGVQIFSMPEDFMSWMLQPYMVYE